jgi:ubiquinone/menaquinone biosynthesis C-methylase UbiE
MKNALNNGPLPLSVDAIELPLTSIDELMPMGPTFIYNLISKILGFNLKKFSLPDGLTGKNKIPSYALQEFHGLPNGYYSVYFSRGYSTGFNAFMLGEMCRIRNEMAKQLSGCSSVLDLGCGDGSSTKFLKDQGIQDVWGLDPSPYLLVQAIQRNETIKFVQGVAESTGFDTGRFDGVCACWVLHEIPTQICDLILKECFRILKPGGKLVFMEPSKNQFRKSFVQLFKEFGLRGLYYRFLAIVAHEPYVKEWQQKEIKSWLESQGFDLVSNVNNMPEEMIVAQKPKTSRSNNYDRL